MVKLITREEAKEIDKKLLEKGATIESLIEIAGFLAFDVIVKNIIFKNSKILVAIGPGNNGSDGLVIARYLQMCGHNVTIFTEKVKHDKLLEFAKNCGVQEEKITDSTKFDFVIDAVFGFSFKSPLREPYKEMVYLFKNHHSIISIDTPSDDEMAVKYLITFVAPKTISNCENIFVTRSFVPKDIYDDNNDYKNHRKIN